MGYLLEAQWEAALQVSHHQVFLDQIHLCLASSAAASSSLPAVLVKILVVRFEHLMTLEVDVASGLVVEANLVDQVGHAVDTQVLQMVIFSFVFCLEEMIRYADRSVIDW